VVHWAQQEEAERVQQPAQVLRAPLMQVSEALRRLGAADCSEAAAYLVYSALVAWVAARLLGLH
jgi:hypothetical protein